MKKKKPSIVSQLSTLSDRTRLRLLRILTSEEYSVRELVSILDLPQSTISRHIKILLEHGWLSKRGDGNSNCYRCATGQLSKQWLALWRIIEADDHPSYEQDLRRSQTVISLRTMDSAEFFQRNAEQWSTLRQELFGNNFLLPTLLSILPKDQTIADLGCGNGEALLALAPSGARLIGIDISQKMLQIAAQRTALYPNISLREGLLTKLPLDDAEVDTLFCMLVLHHISMLEEVFAEMHRCLNTNGQVIILDTLSHNQSDMLKMGHQHLGFSIQDFEQSELFQLVNFQILPKASGALGPALFIATMEPKQ